MTTQYKFLKILKVNFPERQEIKDLNLTDFLGEFSSSIY